MKASERLEIIIDEVQTNGIVKVAEISGRLGCSEVTIRNDIRKLDQQGVLKKTYGGAVRKENGLSVEFIPGEYFLNSDKKYRIAKRDVYKRQGRFRTAKPHGPGNCGNHHSHYHEGFRY